jgi:hypothetical protein
VARAVIGVSADLVVEAAHEGQPVRGRVIAVAVDDADSGCPPSEATWLLVADDDRPAPVWVAQAAVTGQRLGR